VFKPSSQANTPYFQLFLTIYQLLKYPKNGRKDVITIIESRLLPTTFIIFRLKMKELISVEASFIIRNFTIQWLRG